MKNNSKILQEGNSGCSGMGTIPLRPAVNMAQKLESRTEGPEEPQCCKLHNTLQKLSGCVQGKSSFCPEAAIQLLSTTLTLFMKETRLRSKR